VLLLALFAQTTTAACSAANVVATYPSDGFYDKTVNVYIPESGMLSFDLNKIFSYDSECD
jgi:hypothetical protein